MSEKVKEMEYLQEQNRDLLRKVSTDNLCIFFSKLNTRFIPNKLLFF